MDLATYRETHGLSLEAMASRVGKSKGHLHAVESASYATAKLALAIEAATGGAVDAATLNPEIAQARQAAA